MRRLPCAVFGGRDAPQAPIEVGEAGVPFVVLPDLGEDHAVRAGQEEAVHGGPTDDEAFPFRKRGEELFCGVAEDDPFGRGVGGVSCEDVVGAAGKDAGKALEGLPPHDDGMAHGERFEPFQVVGEVPNEAVVPADDAVCRDGGRDRIFNKMVCSFVLCSALAFVVFLLLSLCVMAFQLLFAFDQSYYKVYVLFFYFSSIVVGWNALLACVPQGRETVAPSAALQRLVAYIVLPINGLYTVILYGYIAMIAWQGTMPVGKMNWFASIAVLIYVFCFLTCHDYERPPYLKAYVRWGGVLLVPIVAVQLVGVYIRYDAYGLTTLRYVSMACTAFGIIVIAADIFRCSGAWLHFLLAAIAVALTLTPLNVVDLPIRNQEGRMMELLERHGMIDGTTVRSGDISPEDREKLYSAYSYLRGCNRSHIDGAYAPLLDSPAWREIRPKTSFAFYSFLNEDKLVDLTGYGTMYEVDADTDTAFITIRGRTGEITVPIGEYAEHLCRIYGDTQRTHSVPNMNLQLDGGRYLHIRSLQVQRQNGQISHINVMGCLLEK